MTTETIDIRIREDGSRTVTKNIREIGDASKKSADGVDWLKRALAALAGFLAIDKIRQYADAWSSAAGSIRIATRDQEQAVAVQDELFKAAQRTRTAFTDIVELYARTARAGKELGASQREIVGFTEDVGKSLAVQHVSAAQAKGALLQLGQALGSGIVRAEEFNSILEATPYILQIVAKNIAGVDGSVAKLRKMMLDGKLTSKIFFEAFQKGSKDIEKDFQKSSMTIAQGLTIIENALMKYVGELDEAVGFSHAFGEAAKLLVANLHAVVTAFQVLGVATLSYFAILKGTEWAAAIAAQYKFVTAVASGRAVMLGSAEAAAQMAVAQTAGSLKAAQAAEAELAARTATTTASLSSTLALAEAEVAKTAATQAGLLVAREAAVASLAKANADIRAAQTTIAAAQAAGALSYALATARAATLELAAAEQARSVALAELAVLGQQQARVSVLTTEALAAQTTATRALAAAQVQGAEAATAANAATAAAAGAAAQATAKAAGATSVLSRTLSALGIGGLANPWVLLAAAVTTAIYLLYKFGDALNIGVDESTTLLDVFRAIGFYGVKALEKLADLASTVFGTIGDYAKAGWAAITQATGGAVGEWTKVFTTFYADTGTGFAGLVRGAAKTVDAMIGLFLGLGAALKNFFVGLPLLAAEGFKMLYNVAAEWIEKTLNTGIDLINKFRGAIGATLLDTVSFTKVEVDKNAVENFGASIMDGIDAGFKAEGNVLLNSVNAVFDKAAEIAKKRNDEIERAAKRGKGTGLDDKGPATKPIVDDKGAKAAAAALRQLLDRIVPVEGALLEMKKAEDVLHEARKRGMISATQEQTYLGKVREYYQDLIDPIGQINRELNVQQMLLGMTARAREVESQALSYEKELRSKGIVLTAEESKQLREKLILLQKTTEATQIQDGLLAASVEKRKQFLNTIAGIQALLGDPSKGFTQGDADEQVTDMLRSLGIDPDALAVGISNQLHQIEQMYAQVDALRQAGLISEQDAEASRVKIWAKGQAEQLKTGEEFFGQLAEMQSSHSKTAARIGKAAAIAQATIKTYESATSAYAAMAGIPYVGPALGVAAAAAAVAAGLANVQAIRSAPGYKDGGYTGNMGVDQIAGFVHGQEYVTDAETTARHRPMLEAMSRGDDLSGFGGGLQVSIEDYGTAKTWDVQQMDENRVRIIARDVVAETAPAVIAGEVADSNSRVSKSMSRNLQGGTRKR